MSDTRIPSEAGGEKGEPFVFFPPGKDPEQMNPVALAYLGDTIYDLFIRQYVISLPNHRPRHLHRLASRYVSARAQARSLESWYPLLTDEEREIVRRGRNAKTATRAKNADVLEYRHSTAFECLIGYLYYKKRFSRLHELLLHALEACPADD